MRFPTLFKARGAAFEENVKLSSTRSLFRGDTCTTHSIEQRYKVGNLIVRYGDSGISSIFSVMATMNSSVPLGIMCIYQDMHPTALQQRIW